MTRKNTKVVNCIAKMTALIQESVDWGAVAAAQAFDRHCGEVVLLRCLQFGEQLNLAREKSSCATIATTATFLWSTVTVVLRDVDDCVDIFFEIAKRMNKNKEKNCWKVR